jgi:anti-sigma regulatory factor (Ser/Thr protein kinase)
VSGTATELRLAVAARAENLALVRQALAGLGDATGMDEATLSDLKQIATEACMNSIVHAYPDDGEGRIEVRARVAAGEVTLSVRDWGVGFRPRPAEAHGQSLRLGLPLIASLADRFEVFAPLDGGTEVRVRLSLEGGLGEPVQQESPAAPREAEVAVTGDAARQVIARVMAIAATRVGFSLDRMSDGVLIGDVISSHDAGDFAGNRVGVELDESEPGTLWMRVGPFVDGGARRLMEHMEVPGMDFSLAKLADRVDVESDQEGDFVVIELSRDQRPAKVGEDGE